MDEEIEMEEKKGEWYEGEDEEWNDGDKAFVDEMLKKVWREEDDA